ncbi:methyltransferase domain-containing protein [Candidatus Woesearchaeota archaeon]|nr:methyltransferase domain-containing protein [Candidatus Woesearchaeota archaeon]
MSDKDWDEHWNKSNIISDYHLIYYSFLKKLSKELPKNSKVLEAGCGSGRGMACFFGHKVYGIDISDKALELSKKYGTVRMGNVVNIPFKDNMFDLTYNSGVIEHLDNPRKAINEMTRVTKPNGLIVIIVPNKCCLFYQIYKTLFWGIQETPYSFFRFKNEFNEFKIKSFFGMHAFIPLASSKTEFLPKKIREKIVKLDKILPFKKYYAYAIGVIIKK